MKSDACALQKLCKICMRFRIRFARSASECSESSHRSLQGIEKGGSWSFLDPASICNCPDLARRLRSSCIGTEITHLGNWPIHSDRNRVVRASVRTRTAAHPAGKSEAMNLTLALMVTLDPALCQPLAGVTVPPLPALIVRKYCVWNVAV